MKWLTLFRHAKAEPLTAGLTDHERGLNARGRRAAAWVGRATSERLPDLILCSTARRTRESIAIVIQEWPKAPPILFEAELYLAEVPDLVARLGRIEPGIASVWLVGHNPGLQETAQRLASRAPSTAAATALDRRFPTAARAGFALDCDRWDAIETAPVRLVDFAIPPE